MSSQYHLRERVGHGVIQQVSSQYRITLPIGGVPLLPTR